MITLDHDTLVSGLGAAGVDTGIEISAADARRLACNAGIPELERLATTIETWWPCIEAFLETKITHAKGQAYNRVVKLDARNALATGTPRINAYEHAAQPPADPADASTRLTSKTRVDQRPWLPRRWIVRWCVPIR